MVATTGGVPTVEGTVRDHVSNRFCWKRTVRRSASGEPVDEQKPEVASVDDPIVVQVRRGIAGAERGQQQPQVAAVHLAVAVENMIDYANGEGSTNNITGGGLTPTPVIGTVTLDSGEEVTICLSCGGEDSAIGSSDVSSGISWIQHKSRVYWKIEKMNWEF